MNDIQLYVEGPSDRKFLKDVIKFWYDREVNDNHIDVLDGKDNLKHRFEQALHLNKINFAQNQENKIRNVVFLDADDDPFNRTKIISRLASLYTFEFFLWPNNTLPGDLESVLEKIYNSEQQLFFDCWQAYEKCLSSSGKYYLPNRKEKISPISNPFLGILNPNEILLANQINAIS